MYNEKSWWPALTFEPINLWSAPYLGRPYPKDTELKGLTALAEEAEQKMQIPKLRLALSIKIITRDR